jgi:hypothetical protein
MLYRCVLIADWLTPGLMGRGSGASALERARGTRARGRRAMKMKIRFPL